MVVQPRFIFHGPFRHPTWDTDNGSFVSSVLLLLWESGSLLAALLILYKAEAGNVLVQTMALGCVLAWMALLSCGSCLVSTRG